MAIEVIDFLYPSLLLSLVVVYTLRSGRKKESTHTATQKTERSLYVRIQCVFFLLLLAEHDDDDDDGTCTAQYREGTEKLFLGDFCVSGKDDGRGRKRETEMECTYIETIKLHSWAIAH